MRYRVITGLSLALLMLLTAFSAVAFAADTDGQITITRRGAQAPAAASPQNYTGTVRIEESFQTTEPARLAGELLTFEAGARSSWHTNPMGQAILVTAGKMLVQEENGPLEEVFPGDVVTFPPKVRHWFGVAPDSIASAWVMAEAVNGSSATWQGKVNDSQYQNNPTGRQSKNLVVVRAGTAPSGKGNPANFTGPVRTDALFTPKNGSRAYGSIVTFEPCSRTDWHSHPAGQTLIIASGRGYVQRPGGSLHELGQGDIVWTPADVIHWHGAAPDTAMAHIALSERIEGKNVTWGAAVTDEEYGYMNPNEMPLTMQKIALIAAFTASGDIERLKPVLVEGLEAGLTVNQIKEVLIHTSAYAGFPRSLNGINAFIAVMDEREKQGIKDVYGPEASPVPTDKTRYEYGHDNLRKLRDPSFTPGPPGSLKLPAAGLPGGPRYEAFTPAIEVFLKEQLFADLFMRDVLDYRSRQVATVGVISNLPGANAQLRSHIGNTMTQGFTERQMRHLFTVMGTYFGKERGDNAMAVLQQIIDSRKK